MLLLERPCSNALGSEVATNKLFWLKKKIVKWQDDDYLCKTCILGEMSNKYYDQNYSKYKFSKENWVTW